MAQASYLQEPGVGEGGESGKKWEQMSMGHSVLCRVLSMALGTSLYNLSSQVCLFLISHNYNQLQTATMTTIHFSSSLTDADAINSWYHSFRADQVIWNACILIKHLIKHCKSTLFFKHTWNLANGPSRFVFLITYVWFWGCISVPHFNIHNLAISGGQTRLLIHLMDCETPH